MSHFDRRRPACSAARLVLHVLLLVALLAGGCAPTHDDGDGVAAGAGEEPPLAPLAGAWRAVLASPGGELPFLLVVDPDKGTAAAVAVNGPEEVPFSSVTVSGAAVLLRLDGYDSEITARLAANGSRLEGEWTRTAAAGAVSRLPFTATRGLAPRFGPDLPGTAAEAAAAAVPSVSGAWAVVFLDEDGEQPARGEFKQEGTVVTGTFLTPTGDHRYLAGDYRQGFLRLSTFDGGHAFLFHARAMADGTLAGDFWSRDTYHATWTARPIPPGDTTRGTLPDPFSVVHLTNDQGRLRFRLPDLEGNLVSPDDPGFAGKVVVVNLFGSWCPNCNDEAPLLAAWDRRYREQGLEILGLAFEFTGVPERDRRFVRKFAERHGLTYPLLLAGTSDKASASATLPDLSRVAAYPTTIFIGRGGEVRRIQSGFAGPATGAHHDRLVAEMEATLEDLLSEPDPRRTPGDAGPEAPNAGGRHRSPDPGSAGKAPGAGPGGG